MKPPKTVFIELRWCKPVNILELLFRSTRIQVYVCAQSSNYCVHDDIVDEVLLECVMMEVQLGSYNPSACPPSLATGDAKLRLLDAGSSHF